MGVAEHNAICQTSKDWGHDIVELSPEWTVMSKVYGGRAVTVE